MLFRSVELGKGEEDKEERRRKGVPRAARARTSAVIGPRIFDKNYIEKNQTQKAKSEQ